jgi:hypothetical protein
MYDLHGFQLIVVQMNESPLILQVMYGLDHALQPLFCGLIAAGLRIQGDKQGNKGQAGGYWSLHAGLD